MLYPMYIKTRHSHGVMIIAIPLIMNNFLAIWC